METVTTALRLAAIDVAYGQTRVLAGVDLDVGVGEVVCLLGRNGAGKSTLLRAVMGLLRPGRGRIELLGHDAERLRSYQIARLGVGYAPQERGVFPDLTVAENLWLGTGSTPQASLREALRAYFPALAERLAQRAGTLSGGEQKMLGVARLLLGRARLWLLDEPTEGLQPAAIDHLFGVLHRANAERGVAILLVEQNLDFALGLARRYVVLEKGRVADAGSAAGEPSRARVREFVTLAAGHADRAPALVQGRR